VFWCMHFWLLAGVMVGERPVRSGSDGLTRSPLDFVVVVVEASLPTTRPPRELWLFVFLMSLNNRKGLGSGRGKSRGSMANH